MRGEKAVQEAVLAARLEDFEAPIGLELPLAEAKGAGIHAEVRDTAEDADEERGHVGEPMGRDRDMVELDSGHQRPSVL
jgi:hypothetical protein